MWAKNIVQPRVHIRPGESALLITGQPPDDSCPLRRTNRRRKAR